MTNLWPYAVLVAAILVFYFLTGRRKEKEAIAIREAAREAGLTEPSSLHPKIDIDRCIGCATCVVACPEKTVLGVIGGKAELIEPTHCIGHGACKTACPVQGISLVFGTSERGVDLPRVGPDFQTNVPGIFIAGELGGMGLIRNAVEQGRQAMESIKKMPRTAQGNDYDVAIIGAGPAGFAAALAAKEAKLRYIVIEQDDLGGTVFKYPRGKVVMTQPVKLPLVGQANFREVSKEQLLEFWRSIESQQQLNIRYRDRVDKIDSTGSGFVITSQAGETRASAVLLAIGRRGTPRRLGVPGEDQKKVVYQLIDPQQFAGKHVLVVGGGDSALEAATSIAEQPGTTVTLSYRSEAFGRAKAKNREKLASQSASGRLRVMLKSTVKGIGEHDLELKTDSGVERMPNDAVIICAGGILPTEFLKAAGIVMDTKYGTA
ncbi:NAD(P)-binding domain-containing protein [Aestuariivirga sp.]|uniref:NAD(P)-binding domain-containing protein n=1 Tax=Aestuariivirga sp. TaxID=2650926 RepID=UPI0039E2E56E